ncbi:starvation-inducible DNA-binding protein [Pilibacter termitis]|uniref:Starvation-inducible DNA-binding protein n=1 Tax=Pilibacter termitis TaxID=263852 RepID=A0A1T4QJR3_9ENTE|nr:Dps family protein [Pilibacter termitis]SKA03877.1 starvation-inducible DNA-binding protein [Pilibacter termitis]
MKYVKTKAVLNQAVADLSALSALIHQIHWYMRGANFLKLHPKMDTYMDEVNEQLDEISERLITIDGSPYSTLAEFAEHTKIKLEKADWTTPTEKRFEELVAAMRYMTSLYQEGLDASDEEGDDVTNGIFADGKGYFEKTIWMLQAELGLAPNIDA